MTKILNGNGNMFINNVYKPRLKSFCIHCNEPIEFCYMCDTWHHKWGSLFDVNHPECLTPQPQS